MLNIKICLFYSVDSFVIGEHTETGLLFNLLVKTCRLMLSSSVVILFSLVGCWISQTDGGAVRNGEGFVSRSEFDQLRQQVNDLQQGLTKSRDNVSQLMSVVAMVSADVLR